MFRFHRIFLLAYLRNVNTCQEHPLCDALAQTVSVTYPSFEGKCLSVKGQSANMDSSWSGRILHISL